MLSFHRLDSALTLLAVCCGVHILYRKGSHKYPGAIIDITSTPELQLLVLTLFLSATMFLWAMKLSDHQRLLASLFSDMYQFFIPQGSRWWLKWAWAAYFCLFLTIPPLVRARAALQRIRRKTPIASVRNEARSGLWAHVKERRRLRRAREDQARLATLSPTFPQDVKVDLERSSPDSSTTPVVVVEEPTQPTAEILAENSMLRRSQVLRAVTAEWIQLVLVGCYLDNQLSWNANVPDGLGMCLDLITLMYMYRFPASCAMSFVTLYEAAIDNQEAVALTAAAARGEEDGLNGDEAEKGPLIVVTEAL